MKKFINTIVILTIINCSYILIFFSKLTPKALEQSETIHLTATVQQSLAMLVSNSDCNFGTIISGIPNRCQSGFDVLVRTNSSFGYYLGIQDNISGDNSAMVHTDGSTRIPDFAADIASPDFFNNDDEGVGITVYEADTNKENKWGDGSTFNSLFNKYAGIPELLEVIHTSPGYKSGFDSTSLGFVLGVGQDQKDGSYEGDVTVTSVVMIE